MPWDVLAAPASACVAGKVHYSLPPSLPNLTYLSVRLVLPMLASAFSWTARLQAGPQRPEGPADVQGRTENGRSRRGREGTPKHTLSQVNTQQQVSGGARVREREKYYTYPATQGWFRCCQDIPWQIPRDETGCINTKKGKPMSQERREQSPSQGSYDFRRTLANTSKQETKRDK